ncbi:alpha/beta hydrolase [Runella sp. SP2]|uniref:alpha/beta hydrolase n=1 Tax=Runella sp. SP2 TaxID=2268026 RepID=UPI000F0902BA|nr:alpha/beta hydrolase [Runella sp. SP2]AYQ31512.1 alpha/beta hydrolase [Runella sp. SP2]
MRQSKIYIYYFICFLISSVHSLTYSQNCSPCPQVSIRIIKGASVIVNPTPNFNCISTRFSDINIYDDAQLEKKAGIYTTAPNFQSTPINLAFQFIAPSNDTLAKRPFVLMIHEGAYLFGDLGAEMGKATLMAQKGYAAAAINYRIGFENASETNPCGGTSSALIKALYRSVQDTYAAIAFFVNNSSSFGIDTQNIFLAGSSAGSMTITALNYMDENNFEILYPGITQELGPLKPANLGNFKIKGLLSHLGYAITDLNLINANNLKPTLVFQGANDTILPYTSGPVLNCGNYFTTHGSYPVISRLKQLNAPFEWIVQPNSGHNTTYTNEYITDRYALFIKRLFCNDLRQISIIQQNQIENIKL